MRRVSELGSVIGRCVSESTRRQRAICCYSESAASRCAAFAAAKVFFIFSFSFHKSTSLDARGMKVSKFEAVGKRKCTPQKHRLYSVLS